MKNIAVFGAGGHGRVIIDIIEKQGLYNIAGLLDSDTGAAPVYNYEILGNEESLTELSNSIDGIVIAIGNNSIRKKLCERIDRIASGVTYITAIHPSAQIARNVEIGEGSVVMAGAVVNSSSKLGKHCIVNTNASIDHDGQIDDYAHIAPGATLGGNVKVGATSDIALGANVIHGRCVGSNTIIGAGALIVRDIPDNVVAYGVPARIIRSSS